MHREMNRMRGIIDQQPLIKFTAEQIREHSQRLASKYLELRRVREEKKNANKAFQDTIDELELEITIVARELDEQLGRGE